MAKHAAVLAVAAGLLLTGCGAAKEEAAPTRKIVSADLASMVHKRQFGPLARGLKLDREDSGPSNNKQAAKDTIDLRDSARALKKAGRIHGYDLTYSAGQSVLGPIEISESVELFRTEKAAAKYLTKQLADFKRYRGKTHDGVRLAGVEEFDAGTGEEAGGLRLRATLSRPTVTVFATVVAFRRGRVVGSAAIVLRRGLIVSGDVERIADALDDRIQRVAAGAVRRRSKPLTRKAESPDPRDLTLESKDAGLKARIVHEGYYTFSGAHLYVREYDVLRGRLGSSKIFYLRTLAQVFPNGRTAAGNQTLIASRSLRVTRRFLRAYFRKIHFRPRGVSARPLRWGRDTAGFQFFFRVPKGRAEGVELSVRRGRLISDVLVMGLDRDLDAADLRPLREKLRARLR